MTVAAVIEQQGKYLLIEETPRGDTLKLNQPAGHLEAKESIIQACQREVLEETGYSFQPEVLTGIYHWTCTENGITYVRFTFAGQIIDFDPTRELDTGIVRASWFDIDEIRARQTSHRTPLVMRCIEDYLTGKHYPLDIFKYYS
ncbi:phosphatase NudJ [Nitrosomonas stercoris]|uniref:Phosphatase NudJ n=1 Tax=Nitrosomonas stercoris TaxID=1444684 RepID=A0A4Y1YLB7_9PROT|nr:phosphatase NudJ [Nitrosomonas stercoris]